jgi:hypothetical protein
MKPLVVGLCSTANVTLTSAGYSWMDRRFSPLASVPEDTPHDPDAISSPAGHH